MAPPAPPEGHRHGHGRDGRLHSSGAYPVHGNPAGHGKTQLRVRAQVPAALRVSMLMGARLSGSAAARRQLTVLFPCQCSPSGPV
ncbi:hypothetical protein NDU88_003836 [Pleurodeles waltl]|uniref:Uncharacterized protein n=1 Tax=Pleurodeles waltl TaxID=8319 RepID=A0AAV7M6I7_PLEWA|nr:hypothetical protein NDU88_003836 [Pleurodeles waltl]